MNARQEKARKARLRADRAKARRKEAALAWLAGEGYTLLRASKDDTASLGKLFRLTRDALSLSRQELAHLLDRHPETIQVWENGHIPEHGDGIYVIDSYIRDHFKEVMEMARQREAKINEDIVK